MGGGHLVAQAAFYVLDENIVAATVTEASSFGERVHNIFLMKVIAAIFDLYNGGRQGERMKFFSMGCATIKGKERGGGGAIEITSFCLSLPHSPTVQSYSKSNMAGRINDRELVPLTRPNKTSTLQAKKLVINRSLQRIIIK